MFWRFLAVLAALLFPTITLGQSKSYVAGYVGINGNNFSYRTLFLEAPSRWETFNTEFGLSGGVKVGRTGVSRMGLLRIDGGAKIFYLSSPLRKMVVGFDACDVGGFPAICQAETTGKLESFGIAPSVVMSIADVSGNESEFYFGPGVVVGWSRLKVENFTGSDFGFGAQFLVGSKLRLSRDFGFFFESQGTFLSSSFLNREGFPRAPLTTGLEFKSRLFSADVGVVRYF